MEKILIVSIGKYPEGNAGAIRQHAFAKLFQLMGYKAYVIGLGESTNFNIKDFDGIKYMSFRANKNNLFNRILNLFLYKNRLKKFLKSNDGFTKIIVVSIPLPALFFLKKYSKKNNIELIHDSVEWYSREEFFLRQFSPSYIVNNLYNTKLIDKNFKVIAISKFLENHFRNRQIRTIRIPVIMDIHKMPYKKKCIDDKFVLIYAGAVGKKDYLKDIIYGLSLLDDFELNRIELRIFGINEIQLEKMLKIPRKILDKLHPYMKCYGKVARSVVLSNLEEADFTVLLRPSNMRYAKAGFPTKVVESLGTATPVIVNLSSDLELYLRDMENSIIIKNHTPEEFCKGLKRMIKITPEQKKYMQLKARETAEKNFHYSIYLDLLKSEFGP